jgi:hypothetical protein
MSSGVDLHLCDRIAKAPLERFPYPHFYVRDIFPADFYARLLTMLPAPSDMLPINKVRPVIGYDERFVLELKEPQLEALPEEKRAFWRELKAWMIGGRFTHAVLDKFGKFLEQRFGQAQVVLDDEALLVQDITNYALGPHTDTPRKVITLLFYLPKDESQSHLGTSIYVPEDPTFLCPGGPHHPHAAFQRVSTMPFVPNALFAFFKTDNSFHGVEPVLDADTRRWLLLYDIYEHARSP